MEWSKPELKRATFNVKRGSFFPKSCCVESSLFSIGTSNRFWFWRKFIRKELLTDFSRETEFALDSIWTIEKFSFLSLFYVNVSFGTPSRRSMSLGGAFLAFGVVRWALYAILPFFVFELISVAYWNSNAAASFWFYFFIITVSDAKL